MQKEQPQSDAVVPAKNASLRDASTTSGQVIASLVPSVQADALTLALEANGLRQTVSWFRDIHSPILAEIERASRITNLEALSLPKVSIALAVRSEQSQFSSLFKHLALTNSSLFGGFKLTEALHSGLTLDTEAARLQQAFKAPQPSINLASVFGPSLLAQSAVARLSQSTVGTLAGLSRSNGARLKHTFSNLSRSFTELAKPVPGQFSGILTLPDEVMKFPSNELFLGADLLHLVSVDRGKEAPAQSLEAETQQVRETISLEASSALPGLLASLDATLVTMWQGGVLALASDNPDRIRHFVISLRELFTHVLHGLAPDEQVKAWSRTPDHYSDGRPTRRARLLFISRHVNSGKFSNFLEKDIAATLEVIALFQRVHEPVNSLTEAQVALLKTRIESALYFMLQTARLTEA